jgi:hypothetical protein
MQDGVLNFETTISLAWYLTRRLLLDLDADDLPPERLQLKLLNKDDLVEAQREAHLRSVSQVAPDAAWKTPSHARPQT